MAKKGRPSDYNKEIGLEICNLVADGENINRISQMDNFPSRVTIYAWFRKHKDFLNNYMRAREDRADARSDRIDDICRRVGEGDLEPNAARIMIDAEKWQAGKENPSRYGDKVQHTGADGESPVAFSISPADKLKELINAKSKRIGDSGDTSD